MYWYFQYTTILMYNHNYAMYYWCKVLFSCFLKLSYLFYWLQACDQSDDRYWSVLYIRADEGSLSVSKGLAWSTFNYSYLLPDFAGVRRTRVSPRNRRAEMIDPEAILVAGIFISRRLLHLTRIRYLREYSQPLSRTQLYRLKSKV